MDDIQLRIADFVEENSVDIEFACKNYGLSYWTCFIIHKHIRYQGVGRSLDSAFDKSRNLFELAKKIEFNIPKNNGTNHYRKGDYIADVFVDIPKPSNTLRRLYRVDADDYQILEEFKNIKDWQAEGYQFEKIKDIDETVSLYKYSLNQPLSGNGGKAKVNKITGQIISKKSEWIS